MKSLMQRYEKKYLLSQKQADDLRIFLNDKMTLDSHHVGDKPYHVKTYYLDNDSNEMIRHSMSSPAYKEKLRIRFYEAPHEIIFLENKKKFLKQSYKYRKTLSLEDLDLFMSGNYTIFNDSVEDQRIKMMLEQKQLKPYIELHYDRIAYQDQKEGIRLTLDTNLSYQYMDQDTKTDLFKDYVILEVKCIQAFPIWMSTYLSKERLHHQSLSKYASSYTHHIKGVLDVIHS